MCFALYQPKFFLKNFDEYRKLQGEEFRQAYERFYLDVMQAMAAAVPGDIPRVLVAHLTIHGALFGGYRGSVILTDEVQILPSNAVSAGYDYVALGHIHRHQNLSPDRRVPIVYPGSIDRVDFSEATETKGYVIARIARGDSSFEFKEIKNRPMVHIKALWEEGLDLTERILMAVEKESIENAIVRISFEADDEELQKLNMKKVHEALQSVHYKAGFSAHPAKMPKTRRRTTHSEWRESIPHGCALRLYPGKHEELKEGWSGYAWKKAKAIEAVVVKAGL